MSKKSEATATSGVGLSDTVTVFVNGEVHAPRGPDPKVWGKEHCIAPEPPALETVPDGVKVKGPDPEQWPVS